MSGVDYLAYALCLSFWTIFFSFGATIYMPSYFFHSLLGIDGDYANNILDKGYANLFWSLMFLMALMCHMSIIFPLMELGSTPLGNAAYRYTGMTVFLCILFFIGFINFCAKVYFFVHRDKYNRLGIEELFKPVKGEKINMYSTSVYTTSTALFFFNALSFLAVIIICIVYVCTAHGWDGDESNAFLLTSFILLAVSAFISFMSDPFHIEKENSAILREYLQKSESSEFNFPKDFKMGKVKIEANMMKSTAKLPSKTTALAALLNFKGAKINDLKFLKKLENYESNEGYVLGSNNEEIPKNTPEGAVLAAARDHLNYHRGPLVLRKFDGESYIMTGEDALLADQHLNDITQGALSIKNHFPLGSRLIQKSLKNSTSEFVFDREVLDPIELANGSASSDQKQPYVALIRNYDYIACKYFIFMEDVNGLCHGVGLHINFSNHVVIPFVFFMLPVNVYFLYNTLYGCISWFVSTLIPFYIALTGTSTQFWDIYIYFNLVYWGAVYLVYTVVPIGESTYIYSTDVWNNTSLNNTVCVDDCASIDESTTYYGFCLTSFIISALSFFWIVGLLVHRKCECKGNRCGTNSPVVDTGSNHEGQEDD